MSYRNITVDGKVYQYVVGKTHVKVRGLKVWPKNEVGKMVTVFEYCECCGEPKSDIYASHVDTETLMVTPADVRNKIKAYA